MLFSNIYQNKKVLVTGHNGFKGSWLSLWLKKLGAKVIGIGLPLQTENSFFKANKISELVEGLFLDIRDFNSLNDLIIKTKPDFVFHLAAQALVRKSYKEPLETWSTNLVGTLNILESLRLLEKKCSCILITSDKCYENKEWAWGYRENDSLGGPDPYSASKACAELAIKSYVKSFFNNQQNRLVKIASARAGNVIGGGDWSEDRIVPDCIKAWSNGDIVELRSPSSTRPWQHVLEPLSGYLLLGSKLYHNELLHGESFNFGPQIAENYSVLDLVNAMGEFWEKVKWVCNEEERKPYESGLLNLNCDKAFFDLNWHSVLTFKETIRYTTEWYKTFYEDNLNIKTMSANQIDNYIALANKQNLGWAK